MGASVGGWDGKRSYMGAALAAPTALVGGVIGGVGGLLGLRASSLVSGALQAHTFFKQGLKTAKAKPRIVRLLTS